MKSKLSSILLAALPMLVIGCKTQKDIDKAVASALAENNAACDAKMKDMQKASDEKLAEKDRRAASLENEVKRLGGDLSQVKTELGQADTQLASTKTELQATTAERDQLRKLREQAEKEAAQFREMSMKLKAMVDSGKLQVVTRKGRMVLNLPDNILFPSGSKALKKEGKEALISVAEVLKGVPDRDFIIAGHTDNVPVNRSGAFKSNWELSTARAVEVVNLMVNNGVAADHLSAAGFGEFDPIGDNSTDEGRRKNRRLEIIVMPKIEDIAMPSGS
jgi:chemotaxis protein MotB